MNRKNLFLIFTVFFLSVKVCAADPVGTGMPSDSDLEEAMNFLNEADPAAEEAPKVKATPAPKPLPSVEDLVADAAEDAGIEAPAEVMESEEPAEAVKALASPLVPQEAANPEALGDVPLEEKTVKLFEDNPEDTLEAPVKQLAPLKKKKGAKSPMFKKKASAESKDYKFSEHFQEMEAVLFNPQKEPEVESTWKDGRHFFRGYENESEIKKVTISVDSIQQEAIAVKLVPGRVHVLKFGNVPSASNLLLRYNLTEATPSRNPVFVYLRVFTGDKELKRIQVSSKEPWKEQLFDLGILGFLHRDITVTFEVVPERLKGLTLTLIARLS